MQLAWKVGIDDIEPVTGPDINCQMWGAPGWIRSRQADASRHTGKRPVKHDPARTVPGPTNSSARVSPTSQNR